MGQHTPGPWINGGEDDMTAANKTVKPVGECQGQHGSRYPGRRCIAEMASETYRLDKFKVDPNWGQMFRLGEQLIKNADFDGKTFVLEMYQFGAQCSAQAQGLGTMSVGLTSSAERQNRGTE